MSTTSPLAMVITTVESKPAAERLAREIIDRSLGACVQIDGPILSLYRWSENVQSEQEYRLTIKTTIHSWPALKAILTQLHPYDEPQIVMIKIDDSTDGYRDWVVDQTT